MYLPPLLRLENDRIYSYVLLLFIDYNIDNCIVISAWLTVSRKPRSISMDPKYHLLGKGKINSMGEHRTHH